MNDGIFGAGEGGGFLIFGVDADEWEEKVDVLIGETIATCYVFWASELCSCRTITHEGVYPTWGNADVY